MKKYLFITAFLTIFPGAAHAATTLYFSAPTSTISIGDSVPVTVFVNSDQPINAYNIKVAVNGTALKYVNASNAGSLIAVTQDVPFFAASTISFSGGSLTPWSGIAGKLMVLNFSAIATGTTRLSFENSNVYLANGKGTRITPASQRLTLTVMPSLHGVTSTEIDFQVPAAQITDQTPPVIQFISLVEDPFNPNHSLLAFDVADSESGVGESLIQYRTGFFWSDWQKTKNPARLPLNAWAIHLMVSDNAGNTLDQTLYDWNAFGGFVLACIISLIFLIGVGRLAGKMVN